MTSSDAAPPIPEPTAATPEQQRDGMLERNQQQSAIEGPGRVPAVSTTASGEQHIPKQAAMRKEDSLTEEGDEPTPAAEFEH